MTEPSDLFDGADYSRGLPKRVVGRVQCDALDEEGHRCDLPAVFETTYFGDIEIERAYWVTSRLCDYHAESASREWEQNLPYRLWKAARRNGVLRVQGKGGPPPIGGASGDDQGE